MTLVSITVCVRDGIQWVDGCMEALVNQTHSPIEVILVDDGSKDGSRDAVLAWGEHELVTVIAQDALGLSAGRMAAVEAAKGEWVAITDIDVRPEPDWVERMLEASTPRESEEVVAVTGRTIFASADDVVSQIRSKEIAKKYRSRPRRTNLANGPCSMFKRDKLLEIGGFDPSWYHAEDMEVSVKLVKEGGTIVYTPDAVVNHVPETGFGRFLRKRRRDARAHVRIHRRYKGVKHDFIGSSWMILLLLPMQLLLYTAIGLWVYEMMKLGDLSFQDMLLDGLTNQILIIGVVPLLYTILHLRGNLPKSLKGIVIQFAWSFVLWQGIILGYLDAIFGRNGH